MRGTSLSFGQLDRESADDPGTGPGSAIRWKLLFFARCTATREMSMGLAEIAPGGKLPMYSHAPVEIYHVTEGEGVICIHGEEHVLRPRTAGLPAAQRLARDGDDRLGRAAFPVRVFGRQLRGDPLRVATND